MLAAKRVVDGVAAIEDPCRRCVLLVNRVGHLGGVERIILTLAAQMASHGWRPVLACPADGDLAEAARAQGTEIAPCRFDRMRITADPRVLAGYPVAMMRGRRDIERHCRNFGVEMLHVHHPVTALYSASTSRRLGIPLVLHVHETLPARPLYAAAMRVAMRRADAVLCVSNAALRLALDLGARHTRTRVVYNGIDERLLASGLKSNPEIVRQSGTGPHIGVFGVLEPRKAQHVLLQAAAALAEEFPTARFWVVGGAALKDKQAYVDRLRDLANVGALRGRVGFTGFQTDVTAWIAAMDIVVQTSVAFESFGMSVAEAMAFAKPVVVTRVGGLPEVVCDEHTGLVVPPGDAKALATALRRLLSDPDMRTRFGEAGAADARARFSPDVFRRAVADAYDELLTRSPPR